MCVGSENLLETMIVGALDLVIHRQPPSMPRHSNCRPMEMRREVLCWDEGETEELQT